jgi:hypothetical protein
VVQKSVNLKCYFILVGMFGFKPASQFTERYRRVVSGAMDMENLISKNIYIFSK